MSVFFGKTKEFFCGAISDQLVLLFEQQSVLADVGVWILINVEDIGQLVISELALKERDELVCLALVAVERRGAEVELEKRVFFLGAGVLH